MGQAQEAGDRNHQIGTGRNSIGNHEVVSYGDDGSSGYLEDFRGSDSDVVLSGASICVENSNDVVIGTLTQFHGPVTIYQSGNESSGQKVEGCQYGKNAELVKDDVGLPSKKSRLFGKLAGRRPGKLFPVYAAMGVSFLAAAVVGTVLGVVNILQDTDSNEVPTNQPPPTTPSGHRFFDRYAWGGRIPDPTRMRTLAHPTRLVIISHTAGVFCKKLMDCGPVLQAIQSYHASQYKSPDIGYNFLIGGDANIYVGRGWDFINFQEDDSIGVSFMGNFVFDHLDKRMVSALVELLKIGVDLGKLSKDYKLVAHNQTYATDSPGANVYDEICKLPHFDPSY